MSQQVLVAGGSGLVGRRLVYHLQSAGYDVRVLTRQKGLCEKSDLYIHWDIDHGLIDPEALGVDHVINLCGAGIADGRWTASRKRLLIDSRVSPNQFLIEQFQKQGQQLQTYISASAVGYYGDRGEIVCTELTPPASDSFLSEVCQLWEDAATPAESISQNLSILRIGVVLAREGGALEQITRTIPYGIASYIGSGSQYMSWIHIDDLCELMVHVLRMDQTGTHIYNAVAPNPATNKDLTQAARNVINSKAVLMPAPSMALKLVLGEMSAVVLESTKASCERIMNSGFEFAYPRLRAALTQLYAAKN